MIILNSIIVFLAKFSEDTLLEVKSILLVACCRADEIQLFYVTPYLAVLRLVWNKYVFEDCDML